MHERERKNQFRCLVRGTFCLLEWISQNVTQLSPTDMNEHICIPNLSLGKVRRPCVEQSFSQSDHPRGSRCYGAMPAVPGVGPVRISGWSLSAKGCVKSLANFSRTGTHLIFGILRVQQALTSFYLKFCLIGRNFSLPVC